MELLGYRPINQSTTLRNRHALQRVLGRRLEGKGLFDCMCVVCLFACFRFKKRLSILVGREQDTRRKKEPEAYRKGHLPFTWFPESWEDEIQEEDWRIGKSGISRPQRLLPVV